MNNIEINNSKGSIINIGDKNIFSSTKPKSRHKESEKTRRIKKSEKESPKKLAVSIDEKIEERMPEIEKILDKWSFTQGQGERDEKRADIKKWLNCFQPSEFDDAFLILDKIMYYNSHKVDGYIEKLSKELKYVLGDDLSKILFYPLGESPASSGGNLLYSYRKDLGLLESPFPYVPFNDIDLRGKKAIVFFDDIIGSGNQAVRFAENHFNDIEIDKYYVALMAFEKGLKKVKNKGCFINVIVHEEISEEFKAFSPESKIFQDLSTRERIKRLCEKYGKKLYPKHPLGYDDSQALIVFPHNTPNNSLPIIWASEKNEKEKGYRWYPVWERKKAPDTNDKIKTIIIQPPSIIQEDIDLERFFTNREEARMVFEELVIKSDSNKRLILIHGIGAVGKSSLLKMYRLFCMRTKIPVSLVRGEEARTIGNVLDRWAADLDQYGIKLSKFQSIFSKYNKFIESSKTSIGGGIKDVGKENNINSSFGSSYEFQFNRDPDNYHDQDKRFIDAFIDDLIHAASGKRIVLMIDTYEQMTRYSDIFCNFAKRLPDNILFVISGRETPEKELVDVWPGWRAKAEDIQLEKMGSKDISDLVHRYYAYIIGIDELDPIIVKNIENYSQGIPMAATFSVDWLSKHGKDTIGFHAVKRDVVADIADRILKYVPQKKRRVYEAAAVLRYFDADSLQTMAEVGDAEELYEELRKWQFGNKRSEGVAMHDSLREMINEALRTRSPDRFYALNETAALFYGKKMEKSTGDRHEQFELEWLYHRIQANEDKGFQLFKEIAEELVHRKMINRLRTLINDINNYTLEHENNRLWRNYYNAKLAGYEKKLPEAESIYSDIYLRVALNDEQLLISVLLSWSKILTKGERLVENDGYKKAISILEDCEKNIPKQSNYWASFLQIRAEFYGRKPDTREKAKQDLKIALKLFKEKQDYYGVQSSLVSLKGIYVKEGNWKALIDLEKNVDEFIPQNLVLLRAEFFAAWGVAWVWMGRYSEAERKLKELTDIEIRVGKRKKDDRPPRDILLAIGMQNRYSEVVEKFDFTVQRYQKFGHDFAGDLGYSLGFQGMSAYQCGLLEHAEAYLKDALKTSQGLLMRSDWSYYLGLCHLSQDLLESAEQDFSLCLSLRNSVGYNYFDCGALTGLVCIKYSQDNYAAIPKLINEAEQVAKQYEFNDHLALLTLLKGHIAWNGQIPEYGRGFEDALNYYILALIYSLRYNRFLLDEVLSGKRYATAMQSIIPYCLGREDGKKMLRLLNDLWINGTNTIGTLRNDTISPIPENMLLKDAERIARENEPGDGSPQFMVVEQIEKALNHANISLK